MRATIIKIQIEYTQQKYLKRKLTVGELMLLNLVLKKTLESPVDCKEIKPVHPKGNQPQIFIGRTDVEGPILWPRDAKN